MKILYLCSRRYWLHKMSRVRFHAINAIGRNPGVDLVKDGPGFPGFVDASVSIAAHNPDAIIWYKPMSIPGVEKIESNAPKVICYNEMHDEEVTSSEIIKSKTDIVICHLGNYVEKYRLKIPGASFHVIPHCADASIFYDRGLLRTIDILLIGATSEKIYPLRKRFENILKNIMSGYNCKILKHPGYRVTNVNSQVLKYAEEISSAKVVVSCSSVYKYALAKYIEVGRCATCLVADIPFDRPEWYREWVCEINAKDIASKIAKKLCYLIDTGSWKKRGEIAFDFCNDQTQEKYADTMVAILKTHIDGSANAAVRVQKP